MEAPGFAITRGSSRSPGAEGSFQRGSFGGLLTPNHGVCAAGSGILGSGSQSVPSKSIDDGGASFRNHVDSMALRGNRVARALTFEEKSCEIVSRMGGKAVAHPPISQGRLRDNRDRGVSYDKDMGHFGAAKQGDNGATSKLKQPMQSGIRNLLRGKHNVEES
ncbi:mechanosensitive ion channel MscS [Corchorus olitorius]|uniref:Mechanosensitive ion channel MscS n=1 Tax=Corchorus olitorius TaxID=93759 RepID=A0A1R3GNR9_9ROSI|nr:mechanosensitive ion channel MscS [Corchorus olitorius]